ncbi:matrix-remodeling-associated protein 7 isoform X1 [Prinia subflava]|uniref:matrix-remodeling-associated protein 7 isoform X1 n=1 Tax=Prinia subflava TaxID=208062 RepID=UPI002FE00C0F
MELKGSSTFVMIQQMLCSQELPAPGQMDPALLFKVDGLLDFNPALPGAPAKLCPGMIQMCRGTDAFPAPRGPGARQLSPSASPRLGNDIFVCRSSWSERPVSSLLQMLLDNDMHASLQCCLFFFSFFFFFFPAGRLSWPVCTGEMLICELLDRAPRSFILRLFLPHSQLLKTPCILPGLCFLQKSSAWGAPVSSLLPKSPSAVPTPAPSPLWLQDARTAAPTGHGRAESSEIRGCSRHRGLSPPLAHGGCRYSQARGGALSLLAFPAQRLLPAQRWYFTARPRDTVSLLPAHADPPPQPSRQSREIFICEGFGQGKLALHRARGYHSCCGAERAGKPQPQDCRMAWGGFQGVFTGWMQSINNPSMSSPFLLLLSCCISIPGSCLSPARTHRQPSLAEPVPLTPCTGPIPRAGAATESSWSAPNPGCRAGHWRALGFLIPAAMSRLGTWIRGSTGSGMGQDTTIGCLAWIQPWAHRTSRGHEWPRSTFQPCRGGRGGLRK